MNAISTLFELVRAAQCEYSIFDLGRRVQKIDNTEFERFEQNQTPYPYPIQQHAHFALLYWPQQKAENPYIWFLKFPLDEEGLLNLGARNHFVAIVEEALGGQITAEDEQQKLPDNPYVQLPNENKLAVLNAKFRQAAGSTTTPAYLACKDYFAAPGLQNWQSLSKQGMADFAVNLSDPATSKTFESVFFDLDADLLEQIVPLLEHVDISRSLARRICKSLVEAEFSDQNRLLTSLRILAGQAHGEAFSELLQKLLASHQGQSLDVLSILSARCWTAFAQQDNLIFFLEHLAQVPGSVAFESLFVDLVSQPLLRNQIFSLLKSGDQLPHTRNALTRMVAKQQNGLTH